MTFCIQDPNGFSQHVLHESILKVMENAEAGGGAFAFASKDGVDLLLGSEEFRQFIEKGPFLLIVGIDEITNQNAVSVLLEYQASYPNLTVKAFYHNNKGRLFHPKFLWVKKGDEQGSIITGSGNLTTRGLRDNWEAYYVDHITGRKFEDTMLYWDSWINGHANFLLDLGEDLVTERVKNNKFRRTARKSHSDEQVESFTPEVIKPSGEHYIKNERVLLLEWPKGRTGANAYSQVNFGKELFETYFQIDIDGEQKDHYFQKISDDGSVDATEVRPPVIKLVSTNFNFELDAPKGRGGEDGQPIGVFVEIGTRTYRYVFKMPTDNYYDELKDLLEQNVEVKGNKKRRFITNEDVIVDALPEGEFLFSLIGDEM
ncbi:phospholipase D family protein [Vibrio crassostreae]|uniref:phospholipase D family protein n=1 Tax=Vibrio crassostreae TaxID=246167 RepID=UPI00352D6335